MWILDLFATPSLGIGGTKHLFLLKKTIHLAKRLLRSTNNSPNIHNAVFHIERASCRWRFILRSSSSKAHELPPRYDFATGPQRKLFRIESRFSYFAICTLTQCPKSILHLAKICSNSSQQLLTAIQDPFNQPALLLRLTGPGYGSLPNFTLTSGTLSTIASAPFGGAKYLYNSTVVTPGNELQFLASAQPAGNLALDEGYLLTVNGSREGWTICEGALENDVLSWKGNGTDCQKTYVHAVTKAPY